MCGIDSFEARYKILEKIGEGSFSEVLRIQHKATGREFAAKRLKKHYRYESCLINCAEVIAAKKVPYHINILNMLEYHYDSFSGKITFVFELMDMSLYDYFQTRKRVMHENKVKGYLFQLLRGLEHLHKSGLFHRDVKPENILMKFPKYEDGEMYNVPKYDLIKLADLGSVRGIYSTQPYTEYISTRWYRSPECLLTIGNYGPKMDIWAVGCVFYEMLASHALFPGTHELDQLSRIHAVLGTPSIHVLGKLKTRSKNFIFFPKQKGCGLDCLLPNTSRVGRSVLQLMVEYDPDKRINVRRLLKNLYFDDVRDMFELTPEGVFKKPVPQTKIPRMIRRNAGDHLSKGSSESTKINRSKDSSLERYSRFNHSGSKKSVDSLKSHPQTPSIEIPYYTALNSTKQKNTTLPLVADFKIKKSMEDSRNNKDEGVGATNRSLRKNLEIILKSRCSDGGENKYQKKKEASKSGNHFTSKSLVLPKKKDYGKVDSSEKQINPARKFRIINQNKKYT